MDTRLSNPRAADPLITVPTPAHSPLRAQLLLLAAGALLQTFGETLALGSAGQLPTGKAVLIFSATAGGIFLLWLGIWQPAKSFFAHLFFSISANAKIPRSRLLCQLSKSVLLALLLLAVLWSLATNGALLLQHPLDPTIYDSDAAAFIHYQAEDVLRGINPYTDTTGFWQAVAQFPTTGATPLQRGQFVNQSFSPSDQDVTALLHLYLRSPTQAGPEFDPATLHSYPAGAFLLAVPLIWAGLPSTQPLYALALLLLFGILIRWTPKWHRLYVLLFLASLSLAITLTLRSSFEVVCIVCLITAWRFQARKPTFSALLLGLACAVKQFAWLFAPFSLLLIAKRSGWRQAGKSAAIAALVFLLINGPFIFAAPAAWATNMLLPVTEPAFPGGIGLVTLAQGNLLPLFPGRVFALLEMGAYLALLIWYNAQLKPDQQPGMHADRTDGLGLFLPPLPLLLASRSLISYTMFLPVLALAAVLLAQDFTQGPIHQKALPSYER